MPMAVDFSKYTANNNSNLASKKARDDKSNVKKIEADMFKILTTQLKHQDPTEPMKASEFTQQITQISTLKQMLDSNRHLSDINSNTSNSYLDKASFYIGKIVEFEQDNVRLFKNRNVTISYNLDRPARLAQIDIYNADGEKVRTLSGNVHAGRQEITWDGRDQNGRKLEEGEYNFSVRAVDYNNVPIERATFIKASVKGAQLSDSKKPLLVLENGRLLDLEKVLSVYENHMAEAKNMINQMVEYDRSNLDWSSGRKDGFVFNLNDNADIVILQITDESGDLVRNIRFDDQYNKKGSYEFVWDGKDNYGVNKGRGTYSLKVLALNNNGEMIDVDYKDISKVTGVREDQDGTALLVIGQMEVPMKNVHLAGQDADLTKSRIKIGG